MYTSGTVWLWGPVLCLGRIFVGLAPVAGLFYFGTKYYCFRGLRPFGSGSYTARDRLPLKEKQGVDVVTTALTSVRNALQKPETVYDLKRLLLTSRPWLLLHMPFSMSFVNGGICSYHQYFFLIILI